MDRLQCDHYGRCPYRKELQHIPGSCHFSTATGPESMNGEETTVEIGNNTTIRECATIHKGTSDRMKTVIGKNCLIMAYCHIAHDCFVGNNCIFSNNSTLAGHVTIGDNVILAGLVAVHQFVSIGNHAFVTGGSLVRKDVPPYVKAQENQCHMLE